MMLFNTFRLFSASVGLCGCAFSFIACVLPADKTAMRERCSTVIGEWKKATVPKEFASYARTLGGDTELTRCAKESANDNIHAFVEWEQITNRSGWPKPNSGAVIAYLERISARSKVPIPPEFEVFVLGCCSDMKSVDSVDRFHNRAKELGVLLDPNGSQSAAKPRNRETKPIEHEYRNKTGLSIALALREGWEVSGNDILRFSKENTSFEMSAKALDEVWPSDRAPLCEVVAEADVAYIALVHSGGRTSKLGCIDAHSGRLIWSKDLWAWEGSNYCLVDHPVEDVFVTSTADSICVFIAWDGSFSIDILQKRDGQRTLSFSTALWGY